MPEDLSRRLYVRKTGLFVLFMLIITILAKLQINAPSPLKDLQSMANKETKGNNAEWSTECTFFCYIPLSRFAYLSKLQGSAPRAAIFCSANPS